jgi:hypothetical protein
MFLAQWLELETPSSQELRSRQKEAQEKIYLIWTVLSAFEESAAASISNMLMNVSSGSYLVSLLEAESFIMHVEILFTGIDFVDTKLSKFGDNTGTHRTFYLLFPNFMSA